MITRLTEDQMLKMLLRRGNPPTSHEIRMILVELVRRTGDPDREEFELEQLANDVYNDAMSDKIYGSD